MKTLTKEMQSAITPNMALDLLKEGNRRFVNNLKINRNLLQQANDTSDGQHPFAVILSCIDSRTSAELIFDQGLGDVFSVRIAGNIVNDDILGSMEFGCKVAGAKIIVVLGHTKCGAIKGACDNVSLGNLTGLIAKIKPAVDQEVETKEKRNSSNPIFVENVAELNVSLSVKNILLKSTIISEMVKNEEITIVGGVHDISTGEVKFFE
ncbi:MAG: carbonic anhydrase family protein [Bacteroidetes bacterium]|nr:carbonic anhydrase family protein [Bacteroidota bacterium]